MRELLAKVMFNETGVAVHPATVRRALSAIGARLGMPRPTAGCPWPNRERDKRLADIRAVLDGLPTGHVAVYLNEVDVYLNPKIGRDWMNRGKQKQVPTPGKNVKRHVCGALDARTGVLTWVKADRKNSLLFVATLKRLATAACPAAEVIHVVLDHFGIHTSPDLRGGRGRPGRAGGPPLPPALLPQHNRIERV